jgi:hypothetical protein
MTTTFVCPKGDQSDDPEFCSVCGIKMEQAAPASAERCPSCGLERKPGTRFCETCRYDFKSQSAGPPPVVPAPPPDPSSATSALDSASTATAPDTTPGVTVPVADGEGATAPPAPTTARMYWEAVVTVDPSLDVEPDPEAPCPVDTPERSFPLDLPENLVGRRSTSRGIFPQVPLTDPGVSHRHLMVYRSTQDGTLGVSDLGSTNGTFLSGSSDRLEPGVKTPIAETDSLELGRWTRITFRLRSWT